MPPLPAIGEEVTAAGLPPIGGEVTAPTVTATNAPPSPSLWDRANTPLIPQIADAAHAIADHLDAPAVHRSKMDAQVRGFLAGATGAAGDVAASFTSPIGLALTLAGLSGESAVAANVPGLKALLELPAVRALQKTVQAGSGAAFAGEGASRVVNEPTVGGKAQGVVEMATGALGMAPAVRATVNAAAGSPLPRKMAANVVKHGSTVAGAAAGSLLGPVGSGVGAVTGATIGEELAARIRAGGPPPPNPNAPPPGVDRYLPSQSGYVPPAPPPAAVPAAVAAPPVEPVPVAAAPTEFEAARAVRMGPDGKLVGRPGGNPDLPDVKAASEAALAARRAAYQASLQPAADAVVPASGKLHFTAPEWAAFRELRSRGVSLEESAAGAKAASALAKQFGSPSATEVAADLARRKLTRKS